MMDFEKLSSIIAEVLNMDAGDIRPDSAFVDDLGADSLDVFQIVMEIEDTLEIEIAEEDLEHIVTVQDALDAAAKVSK